MKETNSSKVNQRPRNQYQLGKSISDTNQINDYDEDRKVNRFSRKDYRSRKF